MANQKEEIPERKIDTTKVRTKVLADCKRIRVLWSKHWTDMEIRRAMRLTFSQWKKRMRVMRALPPDEDLISSYKRYFLQHNKMRSNLRMRLAKYKKLYKVSMEQISVYRTVVEKGISKEIADYTRPRDLHLAATLTKDMIELEKDILEAEANLIDIKQKLGIVEEPGSKTPFEDQMLITAGNLMMAWELRNARRAAALNGQQQKVIDVTPAKNKASSNGKVQT